MPGRLPRGSFAGAGQSPRSKRLGEDMWPGSRLTRKPLRPSPSPPGGCFCAAPVQVPASEPDLSKVQLKTTSGVDFGFLSFEASSQMRTQIKQCRGKCADVPVPSAGTSSALHFNDRVCASSGGISGSHFVCSPSPPLMLLFFSFTPRHTALCARSTQ